MRSTVRSLHPRFHPCSIHDPFQRPSSLLPVPPATSSLPDTATRKAVPYDSIPCPRITIALIAGATKTTYKVLQGMILRSDKYNSRLEIAGLQTEPDKVRCCRSQDSIFIHHRNNRHLDPDSERYLGTSPAPHARVTAYIRIL